ncbi:MAG: hypothetical protein PHI97_17740 [Desulfobulbus sp.]|nr:hypothetical protein [Desulfobulbus sp.]
MLTKTFTKLLLAVLIASCLSSPLRAEQAWKASSLGEMSIEIPAAWHISEVEDGQGRRFTSPDGTTTLLARWWDNDSGRSERATIRSSRLVVVDGRAAQLLHLKGNADESLKLVVKSPTTTDRIFTLTLTSNNEDFSKGSPLLREMIKRLHINKQAITAAQSSQTAGEEAPGFDRLGKDCRMVDVAAWQHPTLKPIGQRKAVHLKWVQLCANGTYPVFGAEFDYDPQGQTNDFFYPLLIDTLAANQGQPVAFVAIKDRLLFQARQLGPDQYDFNYAELGNPAATIWSPLEQ